MNASESAHTRAHLYRIYADEMFARFHTCMKSMQFCMSLLFRVVSSRLHIYGVEGIINLNVQPSKH